MKNLIVISGIVLLLLNGLTFLIIESYDSDSIVASEISLLVSVLLLYLVAISKLDDAFKIALTFGFILTAIVKYILSLYFSMPFTNNYVFLVLAILTGIEVLGFVGLKYFSRHS
ncbi:MAG: hypothetical protein RIG77_17355 [Cyclobacteriaceae bacterium]